MIGISVQRGCKAIINGARFQAHLVVISSTICCDDAEVQLQCIRHGSDPLAASSILADDYSFLPISNVIADPSSDEYFGAEIVNWTREEALHRIGMKIDCDDMGHASHVQKIGQHSRGDGSSVRLLLRLSGVREIA